MSGSAGQDSTGWQYTLAVRGQVSRTLSTTPSRPKGRRTRNGSVEPSSGLRAITSSSTSRFWSLAQISGELSVVGAAAGAALDQVNGPSAALHHVLACRIIPLRCRAAVSRRSVESGDS
jgi:hypothetical protein